MTRVETRSGKLEGSTAGGLKAFLGIPFAAPPVGERRWQAPADVVAWGGVRELGDYAAQCWQPLVDMGPIAFASEPPASGQSEDCLYLNVWTPGLDDRKRPVLVWIHGGSFSGGTGGSPLYEGAGLARRGDAVVVTINYRLGAFGFLNLNEATGGRIPATGNEGLLDQTKALEWVRDNIEAFGGDPKRVTIFGESAGGMSVGALLAFKPAAGLFHRAIAQSGACHTARDPARAGAVGQAMLDSLGIPADASTDDLLAIHPEKLVEAGNAVTAQYGGDMIFQPCIDGVHLSEMPIEAVKQGSADSVPVMVGATRDEWQLFAHMPGVEVNVDDAALEEAAATLLESPRHVIDAYRAARESRGVSADANALYSAMETDRTFRMPAIRLAEALAARGRDVFEYLFTWESPWGGGKLGSPHAIDLGFVFGTHAQSDESAGFFGSGAAADTLSGHVQDLWLKFASDGDPRTDALAGWQPYDPDTRSTAIFGDPVSVENDPGGAERAAWDGADAVLGTL